MTNLSRIKVVVLGNNGVGKSGKRIFNFQVGTWNIPKNHEFDILQQ
jgi:hypothetical protein